MPPSYAFSLKPPRKKRKSASYQQITQCASRQTLAKRQPIPRRSQPAKYGAGL